MDKLIRYRSVIRQTLQERAELMTSHPIPGLETLCLFDEERDNYQVVTVGWNNRRRVHYITLMARIHNGKIWIEEDGTEEGYADTLVDAGVMREDIVIAFDPPELRQLSQYAVV